MILLYIPIVNFVVLAILSIDMAKSYGPGTGYGIGSVVAELHLLPDARLRPATYEGPSGAGAARA